MKEIDFQAIEEAIIQKHINSLKNPESEFAVSMTKLAARLATYAVMEYHKQLQATRSETE
ncbi:hypothetical protein NDK47_17680 [Brevibacillus ruminantium]|uniref:Uncharacterized protein n=1 Tax=Brevibacillus ruminantium TaxID=2950604 RepID=A0ABY4W9Y1_9BACL|nr:MULTISPECIES: hypothetical protein [Brevibacillus]MED1882390.1 hypothetical protein [Brevibacillus borstelensis]RNB56669.1 hypothetical protein EDM54_23930 [Brevibacillus borstelensis]USG63980.1 hypothetical protein NDK47_17680 [Brevibacillus ruminantium]GED55445.1 hypothetical protein BBO01nite_46860 [Brevibacillus borstelensis]